jgi:ferredoxin--NADP+ reductase
VRAAVVIGNGNVALDVARILAKEPSELAGSDLSHEAISLLSGQPLASIDIVGRRSAADAKFTDHELAELGSLKRAQPVVLDPDALAGETDVVRTLRAFGAAARDARPIAINFHFGLVPIAFVGDRHLRAVDFRAPGGTVRELPAQLAVTCIGYETVACCSAAPTNGTFANENGKVGERLYVVGWAKRGPSGTIPTNRAEAQQIAQRIANEVFDANRPGRDGLYRLLAKRQVCPVDYSGWKRIDAAEISAAQAESCRSKYTRVTEMLEVAHADRLSTEEGRPGETARGYGT